MRFRVTGTRRQRRTRPTVKITTVGSSKRQAACHPVIGRCLCGHFPLTGGRDTCGWNNEVGARQDRKGRRLSECRTVFSCEAEPEISVSLSLARSVHPRLANCQMLLSSSAAPSSLPSSVSLMGIPPSFFPSSHSPSFLRCLPSSSSRFLLHPSPKSCTEKINWPINACVNTSCITVLTRQKRRNK